MNLVDQSYTITRWDPEKDLEEICDGARICYKSTKLNSKETMERFVKALRDRGHHSPLEHSILSVKLTTNRGITHELVRHRLISPNQESTRYCNYSNGQFNHSISFIKDTSIQEDDFEDWLDDCRSCEERYFRRISQGYTPSQARGVLNNDVKSEIKITANYREWRHIFQLRCDDKHAHYQMVELLTPLLDEVKTVLPCIFGDINF